MAFQKTQFLIAAGVALLGVGLAKAEPRIDNVLVRMVPPGATSLIGGRMEAIKASEIYKKLLASQKLPQVDAFAAESGFDPRRDVRELLYATGPAGSVLLARGTFHVNEGLLTKEGATSTRHGEYTIWGQEHVRGEANASGFCILDATLAVAGEIPAVEAALDEWKSGSHTAAKALLAKMGPGAAEQTPIWGVSTGAANFLADNIPMTTGGVDFSKIFRGLDGMWFEADVAHGLRAEVHGTTARDEDAVNLRDAVRGLVGMGRLSVPNNQPEMLRLWDGVTVEQMGRSIAIHVDIAQDLIDRLVEMLGSAAGRGPGAAPGRRGGRPI